MTEKEYIVETVSSKGTIQKWRPKTLIELLECVLLELENKDVDWDGPGAYTDKVIVREEEI